MEIEPIHELPAGELQYILDTARKFFEWGSKLESDSILNAIADSIKKSLVSFFPDFKDEIMDKVIDANEAMYAMSWTKGHYGLGEGVTALREIYGVLEGLLDGYYDFKRMEQAVQVYSGIATQHFNEDKMQKDAPLVEAGIILINNRKRPKKKISEDILRATANILENMKNKNPSAEEVMRKFPLHKNALRYGITKIYRIKTPSFDTKIVELKSNGRKRTVGLRAFQKNYYKHK